MSMIIEQYSFEWKSVQKDEKKNVVLCRKGKPIHQPRFDAFTCPSCFAPLGPSGANVPRNEASDRPDLATVSDGQQHECYKTVGKSGASACACKECSEDRRLEIQTPPAKLPVSGSAR